MIRPAARRPHPNDMKNVPSTDELLNRAYALAHFILGERGAALRAAAGAAAKLDVAAAAQAKRHYYAPTGRLFARRARTKVSVDGPRLLQRLVYVETEIFERESEEGGASRGGPGGREMLVRFVKHLVRVTTRRNSFYVTLGLSRLLYSYRTAEVMEIYNVVVQDPERVKDDYYYRSRKKRLMRELSERFGGRLRVSHGERGEERFEPCADPRRYAALVEECLREFTPWETTCAVEAVFDPSSEAVPALAFDGADPDLEHEVELRRFHAVLHPDCYGRLATSLGLAAPARRLSVPHFSNPESEDDTMNPPSTGRPAPRLTEAELSSIREGLAAEAARRRGAGAGLLRVLVDGSERARFDPARAGRLDFDLGEGDELVEVRGGARGAEVLLATHLVTHDERRGAPQDFSVELEGGQRLTFTVTTRDVGAGEVASRVSLTYEETRALRAAALTLKRLGARAGLPRLSAAGGASPFPKLAAGLALGAALALVSAGGLLLYRRPGGESARSAREVGGTPALAPAVAPDTPPPRPAETSAGGAVSPPAPLVAGGPAGVDSARGVRGGVPKKAGGRRRSAPPDEEAARPTAEVAGTAKEGAPPDAEAGGNSSEATRTLRAPVAATLRTARRVFVDEVGGDAEDERGRRLRAALAGALGRSRRFTQVKVRDEADAVFKLSAEWGGGTKAGEASVSVRLVNEDGRVIWPTARTPGAGRYRGTAASVAARAARDLHAEVERMERGARRR